ncbi:hypothetical protein Ga0466249_004161 [Sporomusaceae bacterium BoRhaA]|nr:hypothetical protein [Pelorhabdus rhamnosifermentans]
MKLKLTLARTLWFNTYRAKITNTADEPIATVKLVPTMPLERSEVPENAPVVDSYVLVLVEDAAVSDDQLVPFETDLSNLLHKELAQLNFSPAMCHFFYPSPPHMLKDETLENPSLEN